MSSYEKPEQEQDRWTAILEKAMFQPEIRSFRQAALRLLSNGDTYIVDRRSIFQCFFFSSFCVIMTANGLNNAHHSFRFKESNSLDGGVLLGESASQSLEGVDDVLEGLLLLSGELGDVTGGGVLVLVGPLDLEGVELEVDVEAVDILGGVRGEAAKLVDERHELVDVVLGDVAALLRRLDAALVLRGAHDGGTVGLADDFDGVGGGA